MPQMNSNLPWQRLVDEKARELHEQVAAAFVWVTQNADGNLELFENMTERHYKWLRDLYVNELPMAQLLDEADLTLELDGPATKVAHPRISVVTRTFEKVQSRVTLLARTISGFPSTTTKKRFRIPHDLELGFTSVARNGGLRFGFTIPEAPGEGTLLGPNDPTYQAVSRAVYAIRDLSLSIADVDDAEDQTEVAEHAREALEDPRIRDAAMVAVKDLSPTAQGGIETLKVAGRGIDRHKVRPITRETRRTLTQIVRAPVKSREAMTVSGTVREIDLDSKRFDLRGITDGEPNDLRCVYGKVASEEIAKRWLGKSLRVEGRIERDHNGKPRLLQIKKLEVQGEDDPQQHLFEFPEQ